MKHRKSEISSWPTLKVRTRHWHLPNSGVAYPDLRPTSWSALMLYANEYIHDSSSKRRKPKRKGKNRQTNLTLRRDAGRGTKLGRLGNDFCRQASHGGVSRWMDGKGLHCVKIDKTQVEGGEGDDKKKPPSESPRTMDLLLF